MRVAGSSQRRSPTTRARTTSGSISRVVQLAIRAAYHFGGASISIISATRPGAHGKHGTGEALDFSLEGVKAPALAAYLRGYAARGRRHLHAPEDAVRAPRRPRAQLPLDRRLAAGRHVARAAARRSEAGRARRLLDRRAGPARSAARLSDLSVAVGFWCLRDAVDDARDRRRDRRGACCDLGPGARRRRRAGRRRSRGGRSSRRRRRRRTCAGRRARARARGGERASGSCDARSAPTRKRNGRARSVPPNGLPSEIVCATRACPPSSWTYQRATRPPRL